MVLAQAVVDPRPLLGALIVYRACTTCCRSPPRCLTSPCTSCCPYRAPGRRVARTVGGWAPAAAAAGALGRGVPDRRHPAHVGRHPGPGGAGLARRPTPARADRAEPLRRQPGRRGLLVLAWALWHRLDAAYGFTWGARVGIGASLLKGADWEEATLLTLVLAAVLPARRHFYRHVGDRRRAARDGLVDRDSGGGGRIGLARAVRSQALPSTAASSGGIRARRRRAPFPARHRRRGGALLVVGLMRSSAMRRPT